MIDAHRIVWNGIDSLEFDVTLHLSFGGDSGETSSFLERESVHTEHYDGSYRRVHSYRWNEVATPTFTFIKQDFSDFTPEENRRILSWLTASDKLGKLEVYQDDSNVLSYQYFGGFSSIEQYKLGNGRVVGYVCEFESNSPYAFSRKMEITKQNLTPTSFKVTCNSDEYNKPIYPKVTIKFNGDKCIPVNAEPADKTMIANVVYLHKVSENNNKYYSNIPSMSYKGEVTRVNTSIDNVDIKNYSIGVIYYFYSDNIVARRITKDNIDMWEKVDVGCAAQLENTYVINGAASTKASVIKGMALGETIVLDGANKIIAITNNLDEVETRIIGNDFNWEWLPLIVGDNEITITGDCEVTIEWIEPRKVGDM